MVSRKAAPAFRRQFAPLCAGASFKPRIVRESERVAAGQGVTIRPLPGRPQPTLDHTFVCLKTHPASSLADFVRLLQGVR